MRVQAQPHRCVSSDQRNHPADHWFVRSNSGWCVKPQVSGWFVTQHYSGCSWYSPFKALHSPLSITSSSSPLPSTIWTKDKGKQSLCDAAGCAPSVHCLHGPHARVLPPVTPVLTSWNFLLSFQSLNLISTGNLFLTRVSFLLLLYQFPKV